MRKMSRKPEPQQHKYGCAVSAVAVARGIEYKEALTIIRRAHKDFDPEKPGGLTRKALLRVLPGYVRRRGGAGLGNKVAPGTIVMIVSNKTRHYLVYSSNRWFDPLDYAVRSYERGDFVRQQRGQSHARIPRNYEVQDLYLVPAESEQPVRK